MANKVGEGFKSVAAAKKGLGAKKKSEKAKRIKKAHKISGFDTITASFVRGGSVRSR